VSGADETCHFDNRGNCVCAAIIEEKKEPLDPTIQTLVNKQQLYLPNALDILNRVGKKEGHWAWWAFPGTKFGRFEGLPKTKVTFGTAQQLIDNAPDVWQQVLQRICTLITNYGYDYVIPREDWGRVAFFYDFWCCVPSLPQWMITFIPHLTTF